MADPKLPGIYAIRNTANGKLYVGSAISIARRWQVHRSNLKTGVHRCNPLQRAYAKHGVDAFFYEVLELVPPATSATTGDPQRLLKQELKSPLSIRERSVLRNIEQKSLQPIAVEK